MSDDKIEQAVAGLLPCDTLGWCNENGHGPYCPAYHRPAVVAWARGLVAEIKAERDAAYVALVETRERIKTLMLRGDIAPDDMAITEKWLQRVAAAIKAREGKE